ncbi:MAG TPA: cation-translocating P-type ATPase [Methanomassiliicoccales archaeon]|nr:cation-translocating P-type ATPase [Methanomassiliicoccales archaeon]
MASDFHAMSGEETLKTLGSSAQGLSVEEVARRLEKYGPNELSEGRRISPLKIFLDQFKDFMVIILIFAAIISGAIATVNGSTEEWLDAGVILVIVIINATLGFLQTYRAEKTMQALKDMAAPRANVIREGREESVPSKDLVPGDIVLLAAGDRVSADARLLETVNLKTNEASLTGESLPVNKRTGDILSPEVFLAERTNMVFSGCNVDHGRGRAVVTSTGMQTQLGRIATMVQTNDESTPLQKKLDKLGKQLGIGILGVCIFIFTVGIMRGVPVEEMFLTSVSLAVAAIPEGLPAIVTISLALGLQRMAKRKAVMRKLPAVESLGSATVICTDKTGTLTKGEMNIREIYMDDIINVTGEGFEPDGHFMAQGDLLNAAEREDLSMLLVAGALCNDSSLYQEEGKWKVRGDPTEGTLVVTARKAGIEVEQLAKNSPRIFEISFDSVKKRMTTVHEVDGRKLAFMKGAAERVVPLCTRRRMGDRTVDITPQMAEAVQAKNNEMADRALRVLAIAMRDVTDDVLDEVSIEKDFTLLGLVGMIDAPRKEAIVAIKKCHTAGIRVIMITGDHELTARAIAMEMGIAEPGKDQVINGKMLDTASDAELSGLLKSVNVFARVAPEHKVRIVEMLQNQGEIVAMTGDGVNDAPALKKADIGVAMGITGTDVSKEASQMILMDDNFASIVNAVEEGRGVYDNIKKFVTFLLSCNSGEVAAMFAASLLFVDPLFLPFLLPIHLLWMNLVTDGFPALALGIDPTPSNIMDRPPNDPKEPPVNRSNAIRILAVGGILAVASILAFQLEFQGALESLGKESAVVHARTVAFCTMVFSQLFYALSARSERQTIRQIGVFTNMKLILAVIVSALLQLSVVYVPGLSDAFRTVALGWEEWLILLPMSLCAMAFNELWKVMAARKHRRTA